MLKNMAVKRTVGRKSVKTERVNLFLGEKMYELCEKAVELGLAKDLPEFLRQCASIRLENIFFGIKEKLD